MGIDIAFNENFRLECFLSWTNDSDFEHNAEKLVVEVCQRDSSFYEFEKS